jgi:cyclopropane fatty-acyl-phospholipid synthase-like methyltransferase
MEKLGGGGYHWQQEDVVANWDNIRRAVEEEREKGFQRMLEFLPEDTNAFIRFVDLGAGDGKAAGIVLQRYRNASAVLTDFSGPMIAKAAEKLLSFNGRWRQVYWDMNEGDWPTEIAGEFDAVISSSAIHHLTNERKRWLTRCVAMHLVPRGVFVNYDLFRDADAIFDADDIHGRTCATVTEAAAHLEDQGYTEIKVDSRFPIPSQKGEIAVLMGRKPG